MQSSLGSRGRTRVNSTCSLKINLLCYKLSGWVKIAVNLKRQRRSEEAQAELIGFLLSLKADSQGHARKLCSCSLLEEAKIAVKEYTKGWAIKLSNKLYRISINYLDREHLHPWSDGALLFITTAFYYYCLKPQSVSVS